MLKLAWRGVRHNSGRYIATLIAIITGVAFFTSTGFLSDRVIDALEGDVNRQFAGVEAAVVPDDEGTGSEFADDLRISGDAADQIAALPEVEGVAGELSAPTSFLGADGTPFADGAIGRLWIDDEELNHVDVVEGAAPAAAGEIAVDRGLAEDESLAIGDQVVMLTSAGQFDATIVGITSFGSTDAIDPNGTVSVPEVTAFDWLNAGVVEYQDLYVRGNVSEPELVAAIEPLTPDGFQVQTGDEFLQDKRAEASGFGKTLKIGLQAFAALALFVGAFVIYNTFSVIVAQRLRELAVLAAIGATPKQIKRSLRFEGLVIGLLGSALGVVAGFALAYLLVGLVAALGVSLPGSGIKPTSSVIIQGIFAGTLITFFSVMIPARRAAKTEPIEALRQAAVESSSVSRKRVAFATVLIVLGVLGLLDGSGAGLGFGALSIFIGVIVAGPLLAILASKLFRPITSLFGLEGRLAADNTARNPQRTATTANALLIGVYLVTLVTVAGTSIKDFAVEEIDKLTGADFFITSNGGVIDDQLVNDLTAIQDVERVTPFRRAAVTFEGEPSAISTADFAALSESAGVDIAEGSFDDLGPGGIVISDGGGLGGSSGADAPGLGSTVTIVNSTGDSLDLQVVGIVDANIDVQYTGNFVAAETFDSFIGVTEPSSAFIDVASGGQTDVEDEINEVLALRPDITLSSGSAIGAAIGGIFDFLINAVNGLLLMSVVVALIGIVNTMSLSILERRRELGLLRVVGMVDRRVRRMVRIESVIIASLGTIAGMLVGGFTGWALTRSISNSSDAAVPFSPPVGLLLVVLVLGVGLGFLAALIPAKRSTRLEVLDAIQAT
jgi:putative ABC transport system permease protein